MVEPGPGEVLVSAEQIAERTAQLAAEISRDYAQREVLLLGILRAPCCSSPISPGS